MNIADFQVRENQFLNEWASKVPGFIRDGVVDANEYFACRFKILMLLKEPNGGADYDLREYFKVNHCTELLSMRRDGRKAF